MAHSDCANCGHSHTYDGPLKPYKPVDTPCWKCDCRDFVHPITQALESGQGPDGQLID